MIFSTKYIRSKTVKYFIFMICFIFLITSGYAQTGVVNNGAKMVINTGAVLKISGSGADYTNQTSGGFNGRIDLDGKIELDGDWFNNATSGYVLINVNSDGSVIFNGTSFQNLGGSSTTQFENLTLNNSSGLGLSSDIVVREVLALTNGLVALNSSDLYIGNTGSITGTFGPTKMIVTNGTGSLRKGYNTGGSFTFPIGDTTNIAEYSPVVFDLTGNGGFSSAWVGARVVDEIHPQNTSPSEYLTRYWRIGSSGITSPVFDADFYYKDSDIQGTENLIFATEYNDVLNRSVLSVVNDASNIVTVTGMNDIENTYAEYTGEDGTVPSVAISSSESDPTNADPIPFTITFSEEVSGFVYTDISIDNGSTSAVSTSDNISFDFDVTPTLDGDVIINVIAGVATDIAGNENTAAIADTIEYDSTNPTVEITSTEPDPTNSSFDVSIHFNEEVSGFDSGDITVVNGSKGTFTPNGNGQDWTLQVIPSADGLVTVDIGAAVANDLAGNGNNAATQYSVTYDITNPNANLTSAEPDPTNSSFTLTIEFDEGVTDFELTDLTLGNCNAGSYLEVKTDTTFTVEISPIADGTVTVDLPANQAHDYAGNGNNAAAQFTIEYDATNPGVSITSAEPGPTNGSFDVSIHFDEVVTGFVSGDVTVTNGSKGPFTPNGNGQDWTLQIIPTTDGLVTVEIAAGVADDAAGNGNDPATPFSIMYDITAPSVLTLNPSDGATGVSITTNLDIVFDEVVNATTGNITLVETGVGTVETFDVATTDIEGDSTNTITIDPTNDLSSLTDYHVLIDASAFEDEAGNSFSGFTLTTDWNFTSADVSNPYITGYSPTDNANNVVINTDLELTFSENIVKGTGNITIMNASGPTIHETIDVTTGQVSILNNVVTINPGTDFDGESDYYILIDAGAFEDATSNPFAGITNTAEWNFTTEDIAGPSISTLNPADEAINVAIDSDLEITFNENVFVGTGSITITDASGPTVHETIAVGSVSIADSVVTINPTIDFDGESNYYVEVDATAFKDASDNYFTGISGATDWNFGTEDVTAPTVSISTLEASPTNSSPFEVTITFNEEIQNFIEGDISVTNGSASNLNTSDNEVFTADITPGTEGNVSVIIPAGVAQDLAGNYNTVSNQIILEYDITSPTVEITGPTGPVAAAFDVTITFNEGIVDLVSGNISLGGTGTASVTNLSNTKPDTTWVATITPTADGSITVDVIDSEVTDLAGNGNIASNQFTIDFDSSGPSIITLSPSDGSTGVLVSEILEITFDEIAYLNTGNVEIRYQSNDALFESISVSTLGGDGTTTISINPSSDFDSETSYYVLIDSEAFIDALGNGFDGIAVATDWEFTTIDVVDPVYTNLSPVDEATGVLVNTNLEITFSENVNKNVGNITIMDADALTEYEIIDVTTGQVTVTSNVATINPSVDLIGETNYYVVIDGSTFQDLSGNNFGGIFSSTEWNFYTQDVIPPLVTNVSPSDNATDILISSNLELTFDENVLPGTGNITIVDADAASNFEVIEINDANINFTSNVVTISPTSEFAGLTNYYVLIDATAIEDVFGNTYAGIADPTVWNYTTADGTAPIVTNYSPLDGATDVIVTANLVLTFDEDISPGTGNITIVDADAASNFEVIDITGPKVTFTNNELTIDPTSDFSGLTNYYVLIDATAIEDGYSNAYTGISLSTTWNFITEDVSVPVATNFSPGDNSTGLANNINLEITFSEDVFKNTGNIVIYNSTTSTTHETIDVNSANVSISSNVVTINPNNDFVDLNDYYVQVDNGALQDLDGYNYSGISDAVSWNFSIGDNTIPSIVSLTPADNATGVSLTANLVIEFDEDVVANSGNVTIVDAITTATHHTIDVTAALIVNNVVTLDPGIDFEEAASYYVLIDNDAFRDLAGNSFAGISGTTTWNFETPDLTVPTIASVSPVDGATEVSVSTDLVITFSEAVVANSGLITIMDGSTSHESIDVESGQVNISLETVTINPTIDLDGETNYHVLIDNGAFHDLSGNSFAGLSDETIWNFSTEDISQPSVTITSLESGTVTENFIVTFTFSEVVTGFESTDIDVTNATISGFTNVTSGLVWTTVIEPIDDGEVTVDVAAGVAQDVAGNLNTAASQLSITYDSGVGLENVIPFQLSIYSIGERVIVEFIKDYNYSFEKGTIVVYNLVGQKIVESEIDDFTRFETTVNHVSQVYLVKVVLDDKEYTKRLFVE